MKPLLTTLKNGVRMVQVPMNGTEAATLLVLVGVGSRHEQDAVWGGSHFVEHLMFKGTKRRPTTAQIARELDRYGAEYNAYTGKDLTGYHVKIAGSQLPVAVDILEDMLFHSKYDAAEMTREKKVIMEEIKMYEENPLMHIHDLLEEAALGAAHPLGRSIAGTHASMRAMRRNDVIAHRDRYYVPKNIVVVLSGAYPASALASVRKKFGALRAAPVPEAPVPFALELPGTPLRRQTKQLEQVQVAMAFRIPGRTSPDTEALKLLALMLGGTMSSRLFLEVRERRGLCYSIRAGVDQYADAGILSIRAGLDAQRLRLALSTVVKEVRSVILKGVTAKELADAKENLRGALALQLEDSCDRAEFYGRQLLQEGTLETPQERLARFDKVRLADIRRVAAHYLTPKDAAWAVVGPYADDQAFLAAVPKA